MAEENEESPDEVDDKKRHGKRYGKHIADVRREAFVSHVIDATLAAEKSSGGKIDYRRCAELAGYSPASAKQMSYYLRSKPDVQDQIRMRLAAAGISDAEIIGVPASIIRYTLADCCDFFPDGSFRPNWLKATANGSISAIKSAYYDARGNPRVELYDKLKASDQLASIRGLKRADVKPDDLALRRMALEDNIRRYYEKRIVESNGDVAYAEGATAQYKALLATMPENRPFMDLPIDDRTDQKDPTS